MRPPPADRHRPSSRVLLAGVIVVALLTRPGLVQADDGGIENVGGAARLMKDQGHVRMLAETVIARVSPKSIEVECLFVFENHGPADTVLIGFPDRSESPDGDQPPIHSFRSWVDGVEVDCRVLPDIDNGREYGRVSSYWWTKSVAFDPGQVRIVRNSYAARPGGSFLGDGWFEYILYTGASWAGTIGAAEVTVLLDGIEPEWIRWGSLPGRVTGHELHWSFRDFEPGENGTGRIEFTWMDPAVEAARAKWHQEHPE